MVGSVCPPHFQTFLFETFQNNTASNLDRAQSDSNVTEIERFSKNVKRPKSFRRNSADNGKPQTFPIESKDDLINWYKEGI